MIHMIQSYNIITLNHTMVDLKLILYMVMYMAQAFLGIVISQRMMAICLPTMLW